MLLIKREKEGGIKVRGRWGRRHKQLLNDLKEMKETERGSTSLHCVGH